MVMRDRARLVCSGLKILRGILVVGLVTASIMLLKTRPKPVKPTPHTVDQASTRSGKVAAYELSWYAPLWQRDLKQPPIAEKQAEKPSNVAKPAGPVPTLLATFVDSQVRYAHFRDDRGRVHMKAIDESIDHYRVHAIEPGRVKLQNGDGAIWVDIPESRDN